MNGPVKVGAWLKIAKKIQGEADASGLGRPATKPRQTDYPTPIQSFDAAISDEALRFASRQLFVDGHYARAVEEAFKCLNNEVKAISGIDSKDGANLMREAFSANGPTLMLNEMQSQSDKDEQRGYMELYAGSMMGIRNPRAHEYELQDSPDEALEMLILANHLMRKLRSATKR